MIIITLCLFFREHLCRAGIMKQLRYFSWMFVSGKLCGAGTIEIKNI